MWRITNSGKGEFFYLAFLFLFLPIFNVPAAIDPDLMPRLIAISFFCFLSFLLMLKKPFVLPISFKQIGYIAFFIVIWTFISTYNSVNFGEAISEWLRIVVVYSFLLLSIQFVKAEKLKLFIVFRFISLAVLIFSCIAVIQTIPILKAVLEHKRIFVSSYLASSLSNKNFFSEVLVLFLPALFYSFLKDNKKYKLLHFVAFVFALFYIIFLTSLACWIAIVVSSVLVGILLLITKQSKELKGKRSNLPLVFVSGIVLLIIGYIVFEKSPVTKNLKTKGELLSNYFSNPTLLDKNIAENDNSIFERALMIRNSLKMIQDHPIVGAGLNNWKLFYTSYGVNGSEVINSGAMNFEHPHNDYLLIFSEQGIIGFLLYILFFIFVLRVWMNKWKNSSSTERSFLLVILFVISSFLVFSFFSYPRSRIYTPILLMFYISLLFKSSEEDRKPIELKKLYVFIISMLCLSSFVIANIRLNSEIHAKRMIQAKFDNNFAKVVREADKINTYFYPLEVNNTSINWYKGMAYFYSNNIPLALKEYQQAIVETPYHIRTMNDLGTAYQQSGMIDSALSYYQRVLEISPYLSDARLNLSATYYNLNQIDSAYNTLNVLYYKDLRIGPGENYVNYMSVILTAKIYDSLQVSKDTLMINKLNTFITDTPRVKKYIRSYSGRNIGADIFTDNK